MQVAGYKFFKMLLLLQGVQELPEYKDKVSLELEINTKRRGPRETGFISGQLICKDVTMMTVARDAVEAILRGKHYRY